MRVVPLYVNFGAESFRDHVDIGSHDFYERLKEAPALPTTSQPTPQDFLDVYEELAGLRADLRPAALGEALRHVPVGRHRGRARSAATRSASSTPRRRRSRSGCWRSRSSAGSRAGTTDEEIEALIERFKEENGVVFTVATLEYLQKGGRIGRAQALAGTLLNVKPILSVDDGVVHPIGKVRGRQKALEEFARVFTSSTENVPGLRIAIAHADAPEWIEVLTDLVAKARPQAEIELVENLGAVVGTHAGPGAVGFFWFQDDA